MSVYQKHIWQTPLDLRMFDNILPNMSSVESSANAHLFYYPLFSVLIVYIARAKW